MQARNRGREGGSKREKARARQAALPWDHSHPHRSSARGSLVPEGHWTVGDSERASERAGGEEEELGGDGRRDEAREGPQDLGAAPPQRHLRRRLPPRAAHLPRRLAAARRRRARRYGNSDFVIFRSGPALRADHCFISVPRPHASLFLSPLIFGEPNGDRVLLPLVLVRSVRAGAASRVVAGKQVVVRDAGDNAGERFCRRAGVLDRSIGRLYLLFSKSES